MSISYVTIDEARIDDACDAYFRWKDLNAYIRSTASRGLTMPDAISEPIGCYALGFKWNRGEVAGDATDDDGRKIEFKATSRFDGDLSSFGPKCDFNDLFFLRFNLTENVVLIYDCDVTASEFAELPVNSSQTIGDQQAEGRRPHVSLKALFIDGIGITPYCIFDIRRMRTYHPGDTRYQELLDRCER